MGILLPKCQTQILRDLPLWVDLDTWIQLMVGILMGQPMSTHEQPGLMLSLSQNTMWCLSGCRAGWKCLYHPGNFSTSGQLEEVAEGARSMFVCNGILFLWWDEISWVCPTSLYKHFILAKLFPIEPYLILMLTGFFMFTINGDLLHAPACGLHGNPMQKCFTNGVLRLLCSHLSRTPLPTGD